MYASSTLFGERNDVGLPVAEVYYLQEIIILLVTHATFKNINIKDFQTSCNGAFHVLQWLNLVVYCWNNNVRNIL